MVSRPSVFSASGLPFFYTSTCGNYSIPQQLVLATSPRHEGFYSAPTTGSSTLARRVAARIVTAIDDASACASVIASMMHGAWSLKRLEPRSIPCPLKRTPGKAAMLHTAARGACESRRARTSPNISSASAISGRSTRLQRNTAVSAQERRHINSSTVTPGSQSCSATKLSISRGAPHRNSWRQQSRCSETPPTPSNTHAVGIKVTPRNSGTM